MNKIAGLLLLLWVSPLIAAEPQDRLVIGVYTGWEPLPEMNAQGGAEWFRLHRITISDDAIELWGDPVAIRNRELAFSASEGGFLSYEGKFYEKEGKLRVKFRHVSQTDDGEFIEDYGGTLAEDDLAIVRIDAVSFRMGEIVYTLQDLAPKSKETNKTQK